MARAVFLLEDDEDQLQLLVSVLSLFLSRECITARSFERMVEQGSAVLACEIALLDVNLGAGKPSGVDAYHWLRRSGYKGRICFLTGHARWHPDVSQVLSSDDAQLLVKPYEIDSLCAYVDGRPV